MLKPGLFNEHFEVYIFYINCAHQVRSSLNSPYIPIDWGEGEAIHVQQLI